MCNWCKAKKEINRALNKYDLSDRGLDKVLDHWDCEQSIICDNCEVQICIDAKTKYDKELKKKEKEGHWCCEDCQIEISKEKTEEFLKQMNEITKRTDGLEYIFKCDKDDNFCITKVLKDGKIIYEK